MAAAEPKRVFPVTGGVIVLVVCALLALALVTDAAIRSGIGNALLLAPWPLLALWGVYVVAVASDVRADLTGVRVQNFLRRTWAPWSRVKRVAMRWQLEITFDDGAVLRCFGGPARSRSRRIGPGRTREDSAEQSHDGIAALHRLRADSALHRLRADSEVRSDAELTRSWDMPALAALVVLAVWAILAVLVTL
ncbi:PH domain-containing protein [Microbacterium sp. A93]|uniref:PH domain-containing protein n=1 Tax=Microbacterium sp. A93 TaxID=3450716 RepID=UPI003F432E07